MKKIIVGLLFFFGISGQLLINAQSGPGTLDIVSWNVEFFGAPFASGPADKDLQEANVKKILRYLDADLYGLLEVVDTMRLRRVVDSLGNTEYGFIIAPYCSNNSSGTGASWLNGQKQAFIYRKSVFSNITTRGMMRNSATANTNWAAGRFPYMLSATTTINGINKEMNFILIHGKSGSTQDDFNKRLGGAIELKDTLDIYYSSANIYLVGDFNDALNTSIYTGSSTSSYFPIVNDSTDSDHYKSITLPLGAAGQTSMINFPNVIDNHVISNEITPYYIPGSAQIRTDVTSIVPDYVSAHNTSDHYPVFSKYNLAGVITSVPEVSPGDLGVIVSPNPFENNLHIKASKQLSKIRLDLFDAQGQVVKSFFVNYLMRGSYIDLSIPNLQSGLYFLKIETANSRTAIKLIHY